MDEPSVHDSGVRRYNPLTAIINRLDSVWLGITLMVLIFLYMSVASAGILYPLDWSKPFGTWVRWIPRESLGLTEMEAFCWWPFTALLGLFVVTMIVVTVRRIRLNMLNLGVWAIHTGIVILVVSSVYYFSTKLEGDALVFRRNIVIELPGADASRLVVQPGAATTVRAAAGNYQFSIQDVNPNWPLLSGEDAGKTACSVNVAVSTPTQSFIRQMLIGYPQYTEDILPGRGRAIKTVGTKLLDDDIRLTFDYEPQTHFYLQDTAALYVREVGQTEWTERPIEDLPHYDNRIASRDEVWVPDDGTTIKLKPLDIRLASAGPNDPLTGTDTRVTGRLNYVKGMEARWVPGGAQLNPFLALDLLPEDGAEERVELLALQPGGNSAKEGMIEFVWAESADAVDMLANSVGNLLDIEIPDENVKLTVPVDDWALAVQDDNPDFVPLANSRWSYRIIGAARELRMGGRGSVGVVVVEFRSGDETIKRFVLDDPANTHDRTDGEPKAPDPRIVARYRPGPALLFIGQRDANQLTMVVNDPQKRVPVTIGERVDVGPGLALKVAELYPTARRESRLALTPFRFQDPSSRGAFARIKVELTQGSWHQHVWLPFHSYPFADKQYAGRTFWAPQPVRLPDGKEIELLFSRKSWPLPAAVALDDFVLKTHVGGYTPGNTTSVRDFISRLRSYHNGRWSEPFSASLNKPASEDGLYYFQSTWDPSSMAYTGLGVGNRKGVHAQLFGCAVAVAGMIYVFYVKPVIKRRRRMKVWAQAAKTTVAKKRTPVGVA